MICKNPYLFLQSIKTIKNIRTITAATRPVPTAINVSISWGSPSDETIGTEKFDNKNFNYLITELATWTSESEVSGCRLLYIIPTNGLDI